MKVTFGTITAAQLAARVAASTLPLGRIYFMTNGALFTIVTVQSANTYKIAYADSIMSKPVLTANGQGLSYMDGYGVTQNIDLTGLTVGKKDDGAIAIVTGVSPIYYQGKVGADQATTAVATGTNARNGYTYLITTAGTYGGLVCAAGDYIRDIAGAPTHNYQKITDVTTIYFGDIMRNDTPAIALARLQNAIKNIQCDTALFAKLSQVRLAGQDINMEAGKKIMLDHDPTLPMEAATKQFCENLVTSLLKFKDFIDVTSFAALTGLQTGWCYSVTLAGMYDGNKCEAGDLLVVLDVSGGNTSALATWGVMQNNIDMTIVVTEAGAGLSIGAATGVGQKISMPVISRTNNTSSQTATHGGTFTVIDSITTDAYGRVTALNTKTVTMPSETGLSLAANASTTYKILTNMTASGHTLTPTYTDFLLMLLTGWASTADTGSIVASDSLKIALNRLQNRLNVVEGYQDWIDG